MANRETAAVFDSITKQWDANSVQVSLKQTLLTKRQRETGNEAYYSKLCENIAYFVETSSLVKTVIQDCVSKKIFWSTNKAEDYILRAQDEIRRSTPQLAKEYKSKLRKNSLIESINYAEHNYSYMRLKNDMEIDFLMAFTNPGNREFMSTFLSFSSQEVLASMDKYSDFYANLFIQNTSR